MEIRFNVTGERRKELVEAVAGFTGWAPVYKKAPSFAYVVQNYTIDKTGALSFDERTDMADVRAMLTALAEKGFVSEDTLEDTDETGSADNPAEELAVADLSGAAREEHSEEDSARIAPSEALCGDGYSDRLVIEVPLEGLTAVALDNLEKLTASKAGLIRKAVGASEISILREDDRLRFPWFSPDASSDEIAAYTQFIHALCEMAKAQKRVNAKEKPADSEKFAFRCFLLRLGFIGHEYAAARKILLANLPGDGSFKNGKRKDKTLTEDAPTAPTEDIPAIPATDYDMAEALADAGLICQVNASL
jgi:hypothetical protein